MGFFEGEDAGGEGLVGGGGHFVFGDGGGGGEGVEVGGGGGDLFGGRLAMWRVRGKGSVKIVGLGKRDVKI